MPASDLDVVNGALTLLGVAPISAIGEDSVAGGLAQSTYASIRDEVIASHPWGFATKRVKLVALPDPDPGSGYDRRLQLPADYLRVIQVIDSADDEWSVEGRELWTNVAGDIWVRYIRQITAPGLFSRPFVETLEHELARRWAETLTKSENLKVHLTREAELKTNRARSFDGQEGSIRKVEVFGWVNER